MNQADAPLLPLSRRHWLTMLASSVASACGGGGGGGLASLPGTGGTGVYAQGSISGFGSVIVNTIRFDDIAATVTIDGSRAGSADLRLGMVAQIQGERSAIDPKLGSATSIDVWSIARGVISQVQGAQFNLLGMVIQTNAGTVFDGVPAAGALSTGMRVSVWGLQNGADGAHWLATRVELAAATATSVLTGPIIANGAQRLINGLAVTGALAAGLTAGQLVRIQGELSASADAILATQVQPLGSEVGPVMHGEAEMEGVVTAVLSTTRFILGSTEVDASALAAKIAPMAVGARVEVEGVWQGRILKASEISFEDDESIQKVELEAKIEKFTSIANFVMRGQVCNAAGLTSLSSKTLAKLKVGVKVKLTGSKRGDVVLVSSLEVSD